MQLSGPLGVFSIFLYVEQNSKLHEDLHTSRNDSDVEHLEMNTQAVTYNFGPGSDRQESEVDVLVVRKSGTRMMGSRWHLTRKLIQVKIISPKICET